MRIWAVGQKAGVADSLDAIDSGYIGRATHNSNQELPQVNCKFDRKALLNKQGDSLTARLTMNGHAYDFILKYLKEAPDDGTEAVPISSVLEDMWNCEELYDVTYDKFGNQTARDPNEPVHMPTGKYELSNQEILEVYVDMPPNRRKYTQALSKLTMRYVDLVSDSATGDKRRFNSLGAAEAANNDYEAREFEAMLGATQIDGITARQLAKSLAEDYKIDVRC